MCIGYHKNLVPQVNHANDNEISLNIASFQAMETDTSEPFRPKSGKQAMLMPIPEIEVYLHLLLLIHMIDTKRYEDVRI